MHWLRRLFRRRPAQELEPETAPEPEKMPEGAPAPEPIPGVRQDDEGVPPGRPVERVLGDEPDPEDVQ